MFVSAAESSAAYEAANRAPGLQAFFIAMTVTTVLSISLRFWSRGLTPIQTRHQHRFWLDDWFALAAVPFILAELSISFVSISEGFGHHVAALDSTSLLHITKNIFIIYFIYDGGLFLTKASALLFLKRIFPGHASPTWFNVSLWVGHAMNVAWLVGIFLGTLFMCDPIEKNWNPTVPGRCGSTSGLFIGSAVPSVFIDFFILLLPLPKVLKLQTGYGRKIGLIIVFVLGYCVIVVSLGRLVTVLKSINALNTDITYAGVPVVYWVTAEPAVSLLGICVPAMVPLGRYLMNTYFSPIASKFSVILTSRGSGGRLRSENEDFEGATVKYTVDSQRKESQASANTRNADGAYGMQRLHSIDSQHPILQVSPYQDQYKVLVGGGELGAAGNDTDVPSHAIRVDNDVRIT